ncbi:MAG: ABC transporter permease [Gammaproteobacteria bacterium]|nr:ABC transporter permease [Gammaproteobacteria bacterium]MDE0442996.1 ABC transporter permease [Gammaproteobacteria bacterium]
MAACAALGMFTASAATNDPDSREILVMGAAGFSHEDIRDVERVRSVRRATATYRERMTIRHGGADLEASVIAQEGEPTAALSANAAWPLETGRFITEADGVDAKRVAVIGGPVRDRLFGTEATAIGKDILIGDESFTVKGVLGPHPPFVDADLPDDAYIRSAIRVYVPLRTGVESLFRETRPTLLRVFVKDSELIGQTIAEIRELLVGRHGQAIHLEPASPRGSPGP